MEILLSLLQEALTVFITILVTAFANDFVQKMRNKRRKSTLPRRGKRKKGGSKKK